MYFECDAASGDSTGLRPVYPPHRTQSFEHRRENVPLHESCQILDSEVIQRFVVMCTIHTILR